jgi:hypothetical protein
MKKEKRKKPILTFFFLVVLSLGGLLSCGLEAFYYIDYIPPINVNMEDVIRATIKLPASSTEGYNYFDNFIIFYRIYISGVNTSGVILTAEDRSAINAALNSDFSSLYSLTDITSTSVNTSNLENTFINNRKYYKLTLEEAEINDVLGSRSLGETLVILFDTRNGIQPTLTAGNGTPYVLQRAVEGPSLSFRPQPNRYFLNHPDLYNTANATNDLNADVAANTRTEQPLRYTYVSMYIAAKGTSLEMPPRSIYSQPTFIGIFRLAESS